MKETELLELASARRFRTLREKRDAAAVKAGNWSIAAVSRRAANRHVEAFTQEMSVLAGDENLGQRYFIYGTDALIAIKNLAPLEGTFPAEQLAEWRETYTAQVKESLEFFNEFHPHSPEAKHLEDSAALFGIAQEQTSEIKKSNGHLPAEAGARLVRSTVQIAKSPEPKPEIETVDSKDSAGDAKESPVPSEAGSRLVRSTVQIEKKLPPQEVSEPQDDKKSVDEAQPSSTPPKYRRRHKKIDWDDTPKFVKPRSTFHSRGVLLQPDEMPERPQKSKGSTPKGRRGSDHSNPFKTRENHLSPADRQKIDLIRQAAEVMAATYVDNLGTDPDRSHRSTQIRAIFPKFTPSLIYGASPKIGRKEANQERNFNLKEIIRILLYGSRTTQNILQTKKFQAVIPQVIEEAIAKAVQAKQLSEVKS